MRSNQILFQNFLKDEYNFDFAKNVYIASLKELYNNKLNVQNVESTVKGGLEFMDLAAKT